MRVLDVMVRACFTLRDWTQLETLITEEAAALRMDATALFWLSLTRQSGQDRWPLRAAIAWLAETKDAMTAVQALDAPIDDKPPASVH